MKRNKLGSFLLALVISLGLWLYVVNYINTTHEQTFYNVSVGLEGKSRLTERGFMLLSEDEYRVNITVSGSRQDVSKLNAGNIQVVADLSKIEEPGEHKLDYNVSYPGDVLTGAVKSKKDPDWVTVVVARKKTKEIPVTVTYEGDVPADYIKDTAALELDHTYVEISGPEDVVDQIHHAAISVDCTGRTESIYESLRYELQDLQGEPVDAAWITTNVSEVKVYLPVVMVKKIPLTVTLVDGGGATEATTKLSFEPSHISISGSESALNELEELNLGIVELAQMTKDQVLTFDITLPEGVTNVSNLPTASVSISFPRLATREFTITEFEQVNLAAGMKWESLTKQLTITVRGLKAEVQRLNAADIIARVDLAGVENTSAVEPDIIFPKSYESLGVLGSYSVSVQVTPAEAITEE
jgi:YbbR domain-containing protein